MQFSLLDMEVVSILAILCGAFIAMSALAPPPEWRLSALVYCLSIEVALVLVLSIVNKEFDLSSAYYPDIGFGISKRTRIAIVAFTPSVVLTVLVLVYHLILNKFGRRIQSE